MQDALIEELASFTNDPLGPLMEALSYDSITGHFVWKKKISDKVTVGQRAGSPSGSGYIKIKIYGKRYYAHVLAWAFTYGKWPSERIDHKDRVGSHNWINNLREAEAWQNGHNSKKQINNTSGERGVHWDSRRQRWHVQVRAFGRIVFNKRFESFDIAAATAKAVRAKVAGEFFNG